MKDIANKTGLGLATISKYLNGGSVREKNRLAIEKAIAELDFTVNEFARSLKTSKSKTIGVLIPELSNVFITSVITVLEDILRQNGYGIIVCDSRTDEERQKDAIEFLLSKMVDGIVMMPVGNDSKCLKPALDKKLPVVLVDRTIPSLENQVGEVMVDSRGIARDVPCAF
ncbi:MAG: LacI family DNA-binding transcriptional regulator [[Clostridium] leptum]